MKAIKYEPQGRILVPVSGDKDSQMCFAMAVDLVGPERVLGIHQDTGFDHSLTHEHMRYMRERYGADIISIKSDKYDGVIDVMMSQVIIPGRFARTCTRALKTDPWFKWLSKQPDRGTLTVWLGMRAAESNDRRANYGDLDEDEVYSMGDLGNKCPAACRDVLVQLPIVQRSTPSVYEFFRKRKDKINPLYSRGHKRVGCFPCALGGNGTMRLAARDPEGRENLAQMSGAVQAIFWAKPVDKPESIFRHDLEKILEGEHDPFGLLEPIADDEQTEGGCSWCNQ